MVDSANIPGGFIIKARCIENSIVSSATPCTRETWNWLLLNANYIEKQSKGFTVKRGQLFRRFKDIRDALSWYVGFRKESYSESQMKASMKYLTNELMITTMKHRLGVMITICNYDKYQNIKNYEQTNEKTNENPTKLPTQSQVLSDKKQELKKTKKKTKKTTPAGGNLPVVISNNNKKGHYSDSDGIENYLSLIDTCCEEIQRREPRRSMKTFNAYQWVQLQINNKKHPGAIYEALRSLILRWQHVETTYIGYVTNIINIQNGNYYAADNQLNADNYNKTMVENSNILKNLGIDFKKFGIELKKGGIK